MKWPPRSARIVPCTDGLVDGTAAYRARTRLGGSCRALGFDLASRSELAVRGAGPQFVSVRAETRILIALEALASAAQVVCREFFRFVDRGGIGDRLVMAFFVLDNQRGQTQIGVALQRRGKSVIARFLKERRRRRLTRDRVSALAGSVLLRLDLLAALAAEHADEAPDRVFLPPGGFHGVDEQVHLGRTMSPQVSV